MQVKETEQVGLNMSLKPPAVSTVLRMHRAGEEGAVTLGRVIVQERRYLDGRY